MRLRGVRGSRNVEDRRRMSAGKAGGVGLLGMVVLFVLSQFLGVDLTSFVSQSGGNTTYAESQTRGELTAEEQREGEFASRVLATTEAVWADILPKITGRAYEPPVMVLYSGVTQSPCGGASGATGPFYCPADEKAYLDTEFFATMHRQMGAGGDFAAAYVIAHEVAHHVQNELGILPKVHQMRMRSSKVEANALTVRLELQADCLSGVWARNVEGLLEPGDLKEALNAARQIGDDTIQRRAGRVPQPHTFTHGTSEQRQRWFATGYKSGDPNQCDTFGTRQP